AVVVDWVGMEGEVIPGTKGLQDYGLPDYGRGNAVAGIFSVKSWSKFVTSAGAEVTTYKCPRSGSTECSATGVTPTGAGLPNSSSRLLSCAWVPVAGHSAGGARGAAALRGGD